MAKPSAKTRLSARLVTYQSKVDDVFFDVFPNWRDGPPGGGQDLDWTRISAANRDVLQTDLTGGYRWTKGRYLKASWRPQVIDRDAMTQSQAMYQNSGGSSEPPLHRAAQAKTGAQQALQGDSPNPTSS